MVYEAFNMHWQRFFVLFVRYLNGSSQIQDLWKLMKKLVGLILLLISFF